MNISETLSQVCLTSTVEEGLSRSNFEAPKCLQSTVFDASQMAFPLKPSYETTISPLRSLMLPHNHRYTDASHIVMQVGGVYINSNEEEGILLPKHREIEMRGTSIVILFKSIAGGG